MHKILFSKVIMLSALLALILSGCSINFSGVGSVADTSAVDGGIYKSANKGTSWLQKTSVLTVGAKQSFGTLDIVSLITDPQDNKAIYAGGVQNGLFYSYDSGEGWQTSKTLGKITITGIAVDPSNKCVIYVASGNKILKSVDCNRNWSVVYFDTNLNVSITSLVVESSNNIYIGTSRGEIIKSSDQGNGWETLYRFSGQVDRIVINPGDSKNMFAAAGGGIFRSADAGVNWVNLEDKLKAFNSGRTFRDMVVIKAAQPTIFLATTYGLLKTTDGGDSWSKIELITPTTAVIINAVAVNPLNVNEIYYVTNTTFYRSLDGGKNWNSMKLPTSRAGWKLLIDPKNPGTIYMATKQLKKQ